MPRPKKLIPINDIRGLKTLLEEGKTQDEIADYFKVDQATISRNIKKMKKEE